MKTIKTEISEGLVKDLITEFLMKSHLEAGDISELKIDLHGVRHAGKFNIEYIITEGGVKGD